MQRGRGREQIGERRRRRRAETAGRHVARPEPLGGVAVGRPGQAALHSHRRGGRRRQARRRPGPVAVPAVGGAQGGQAIEEPVGAVRRRAEVLVGAQGQEAAVRGAVAGPAGRAVAAVRRAVALHAFEQRRGRRLVRGAEVGPAPGEAGGVHEIQVGRVVVAFEEPPYRVDRQVPPEGGQRFEAEDGVVEVARAVAILEAAVGIQPGGEEARRQVRRVTEQRRRQSGHLQHFEPQTHCTSLESRC